jgi:hypothetical protein
MRWHRKRKEAPAARPPDDGATLAFQRASAAAERAEEGLQEMHRVAGRIRAERERNHFAPLIIEAMRKQR